MAFGPVAPVMKGPVGPVPHLTSTTGGEGIIPTCSVTVGLEKIKFGYPRGTLSSLPGVFWIKIGTSEYLTVIPEFVPSAV